MWVAQDPSGKVVSSAPPVKAGKVARPPPPRARGRPPAVRRHRTGGRWGGRPRRRGRTAARTRTMPPASGGWRRRAPPRVRGGPGRRPRETPRPRPPGHPPPRPWSPGLWRAPPPSASPWSPTFRWLWRLRRGARPSSFQSRHVHPERGHFFLAQVAEGRPHRPFLVGAGIGEVGAHPGGAPGVLPAPLMGGVGAEPARAGQTHRVVHVVPALGHPNQADVGDHLPHLLGVAVPAPLPHVHLPAP